MKPQCDADVLIKALEHIYRIGRDVHYGRRDPFVTGQMTAIAQNALKKAFGEDYPFLAPIVNINPEDYGKEF